MAQAQTVSLSQFTKAVQAAVKAAVQKHPKFKIEASSDLAISYLIRGIPALEKTLANVSIDETQAFANEVAGQLGGALGETLGGAAGARLQGAFYSSGGHIILGIPATDFFVIKP